MTHHRALVDLCNIGGFTPLHYACWLDFPEVVMALMQEGASLKMRSWGWDSRQDAFCK